MIAVQITGWRSGDDVGVVPEHLVELLRLPTSLDAPSIEEKLSGLSDGQVITAWFDYGEDEAAADFIAQLATYGLEADIAAPRSHWSVRPWVVKWGLALIGVTVLWLSIWDRWPGSLLARFLPLLIILATWVYLIIGSRKESDLDP